MLLQDVFLDTDHHDALVDPEFEIRLEDPRRIGLVDVEAKVVCIISPCLRHILAIYNVATNSRGVSQGLVLALVLGNSVEVVCTHFVSSSLTLVVPVALVPFIWGSFRLTVYMLSYYIYN